MGTRNLKIIFAILFLLPVCSKATPEIREYVLGDIDGFVYNGVGSIDDVYVDPAWQNESGWYHWTKEPFDILEPDQIVLFSFTYNLAPNEQIIAATLTLGLRKTVSDSSVPIFLVDAGSVWRTGFSGLNWEPISDTGITVCSVDLSTIGYGGSLLPILQSGLFSGAVGGNIAVDYAQLTLEVIPEPATFLLLFCGLWFTQRLSK